jgi:acetylornithine/succinyldiaminopimelate/putrescine aminotransferase
MTIRELFFNHVAQTSQLPLALEITSAEGIYLKAKNGKQYIDLISGIGVNNIGHCHPEVVAAIKKQVDKYMHTMVYGEYIQSPQVLFAELLSKHLPPNLSSVYFVNSGTEAVEGAMKLAKRFTSRTEIISCVNAYHGSTQGSLSIMGSEEYKNAFRPLLPDTRQIRYNNIGDLNFITEKTACVFVETIQGEAGAIVPEKDYLKQLRNRCNTTGTLLVADEIQSGFGRTGKLFAFEHYDFIPDILCLAKAMGGGMPLGAFISSNEIMSTLTHNPVLGHITTFGGHPVCCAAGYAALNVLFNENLIEKVNEKEKLFCKLLNHPAIKSINGKGLLLALEFENKEINNVIIGKCIENGIIADWFLFNTHSLRIAPALIITKEEIKKTCSLLNRSIDEALTVINK